MKFDLANSKVFIKLYENANINTNHLHIILETNIAIYENFTIRSENIFVCVCFEIII